MAIGVARQGVGATHEKNGAGLRLMMVGPTGMTAMQRPVNWMLQQGHEVLLVDYSNWHLDPLPDNGAFAPLYPPAASRTLEQRKKLRANTVARWIIAWRLRHLATVFQPDVVHAHGMSFRTECCVTARVKPLLVSAWGALNFLLTPEVAGTSSTETVKRIVSACERLIVETPLLVDSATDLVMRPPQMDVVPLGVDGTLFCPKVSSRAAAWRFALNIPDDTAVILSPRGWDKVYNQDLVLEAFAAAYHRFRRPVCLAFVALGRGPMALTYFQRCQTRAQELGIQHALRVFPVLPHTQMPDFYAVGDVIVNYPSTDAFPSTLVEAVACQRPIITSRLPSYRGTYIEEFLTLVEPDNPLALADAMLEAINQPAVDSQARLANARRAVLDQYSEELAVERLLQIYRELARPD